MNKTDANKRIKELIELLNRASKAYYNEDKEIMPNIEYDRLYDELRSLEDEYDIHMSNSPTNNVGYEISDELPKVRHEKPMLSLDKTKDREQLKDWLGDNEGMLSYKLDGLTVVLTYEKGVLDKAVTRGNGEIGELVTNNAKNFCNVPLKINYKGHLVLRGEAIISYKDFNIINENMTDEDAKYKNPRNLCSGSVRQLDPKITKERNVRLCAFSLVEHDNDLDSNIDRTYENQMDFLSELGFEVVIHKPVTKNNILKTIEWFEQDIKTNDYPSDGLVLMLNDIKYGESLGMTSKFPRNAIAFKWQDETAETTLREIEWSPSRTGLLNPVAIFDEVELEGTTVKRASLHNISIIEELQLGIGDKIKVYKANMIIPQVSENLTKSNKIDIIDRCPVCNSKLKIHDNNGVKTLHCENEDCPVKHIKSFENFVSRDAMNIEGISIATLEKFISLSFIKEYADLYKLSRYKDDIIELEGFGEKSYKNIIDSIEDKREVETYRLINSLGITGIGKANAKVLAKHFEDDFEALRKAKEEELCNIQTIGPILAKSIYDYFNNKKNALIVDNLLKEIKLKKSINTNNSTLSGLTFVITGNLTQYENRDAMVKVIEDNGGKVSSTVSSKTSYLINNDLESNSTKNKTAKKLNIPIINEQQFKEMIK